MIEIALSVVSSLGAGVALLRYLHNAPSNTVRRRLAVAILGGGGGGGGPREPA